MIRFWDFPSFLKPLNLIGIMLGAFLNPIAANGSECRVSLASVLEGFKYNLTNKGLPAATESFLAVKNILDEEGPYSNLSPAGMPEFAYPAAASPALAPSQSLLQMWAPSPTGWTRNAEGKIVPSTDLTRDYLSIRDLRGHDGLSAFFGGWDPFRSAETLKLNVVEVQGLSVARQNENYLLLPRELRSLFDNNRILVTSGEGLNTRCLPPAPNGASCSKLAGFENPNPWSVLMSTAPDSKDPARVTEKLGRTGVVLLNGRPLTVEVGGQEFLVEIKGIGLPTGGFKATGKENRPILGGAIPRDSHHEFDTLEEFKRIQKENGHNTEGVQDVLVAASLEYLTPDGPQSFLIRLTPTTQRATFINEKDLDTSKMLKEAGAKIEAFADRIGEIFSAGFFPRTHPENLLWSPHVYGMTDFQDIHALEDAENLKLNPLGAIETQVTSITEIAGYHHSRYNFFENLKKGLIRGFKRNPFVSPALVQALEAAKNREEISAAIWNFHLAQKLLEKTLGSKENEFLGAFVPNPEFENPFQQNLHKLTAEIQKELNYIDLKTKILDLPEDSLPFYLGYLEKLKKIFVSLQTFWDGKDPFLNDAFKIEFQNAGTLAHPILSIFRNNLGSSGRLYLDTLGSLKKRKILIEKLLKTQLPESTRILGEQEKTRVENLFNELIEMGFYKFSSQINTDESFRARLNAL